MQLKKSLRVFCGFNESNIDLSVAFDAFCWHTTSVRENNANSRLICLVAVFREAVFTVLENIKESSDIAKTGPGSKFSLVINIKTMRNSRSSPSETSQLCKCCLSGGKTDLAREPQPEC